MQYELKTQVIEPQRKTFTHLIERFGDRPASRYEEGTIDLQATENFHYRPTWAPEQELYDPDYSAFKLTDPYSFTDPRQFYYTPYVTTRAQHARGLRQDPRLRRHARSLRQAARGLAQHHRRHLRARCATTSPAASCIFSGACRFGYGTTITQCCAYAAFDRIGNAQLISPRRHRARRRRRQSCSTRRRRPGSRTPTCSRLRQLRRGGPGRVRLGRRRSSPSTCPTSSSTRCSTATSTRRPCSAVPAPTAWWPSTCHAGSPTSAAGSTPSTRRGWPTPSTAPATRPRFERIVAARLPQALAARRGGRRARRRAVDAVGAGEAVGAASPPS